MTGQLALTMLLWCCPVSEVGEPPPGVPMAVATVAVAPVTMEATAQVAAGMPVGTWSHEQDPGVTAARPDAWVGEDKAQHLGLSFGAAMFLYGAGRTVLEPGPAQLAAVGGSLTLGLVKELWDARSGGTFSVRDLAWDVIGVSLGALLTGRMD